MMTKKPLAVLTLAWSCALAVVVLVSADCSVNHRSGEFACTTTADCPAGRTCQDAFCVVPGGGSGSGSDTIDAGVIPDGAKLDANMPPVDAGDVCPAICTSCDPSTHACTIDCSVDGRCSTQSQVTCPVGFFCNIDCSPDGSCHNVACTGSLGCTIACTGQNSCRTATCGSGPCDVDCSGDASCRTVTCADSCQCDVTCPVNNDCLFVTCSAVVCQNPLDGGCSSSNANSCQSCQP